MTTGDVYARYLVRLEEMKQSLHIVRQLIDNLPAGPVDVSPEGKEVLPPKGQVYSSIEGLIQHFELIMTNRGWTPPIAEAYMGNEGPNGEQGFYIVSDGSPRSFRAKTRPACFNNYQVMAKLTEGHMLADVVAILGSINVVAAELDR
jgi:NADH-quinone oxidoreductase subunit D